MTLETAKVVKRGGRAPNRTPSCVHGPLLEIARRLPISLRRCYRPILGGKMAKARPAIGSLAPEGRAALSGQRLIPIQVPLGRAVTARPIVPN